MSKRLTHLLHVHAGEYRVAFGAHPLHLPRRFVYLYGLLALRWLEVADHRRQGGSPQTAPDLYITVPEIAQLDKWRESFASSKDIGQTVYKHTRETVQQNPALGEMFPEQPTLIVSPNNKKRASFRLRSEDGGVRVEGVEGRAAISRLRQWLKLPPAIWDEEELMPLNPLAYDQAYECRYSFD